MGNLLDRGISMVTSLSFPRSRSTEDDDASLCTYTYPRRDGLPYFSPHFFMGGKRFDSFQPESYLFGDNGDLNHLGIKPNSFPYDTSMTSEPTKCLKSLVHIRKESIRFVRVTDPNLLPKESQDKTSVATTDQAKVGEKDQKSVTKATSPLPASQNKTNHHHHKKEEAKGKQQSNNDITTSEKFYYNIEFTFDSDVACCVNIFYFCLEEVTASGIIYHPKDWSICHEKIFFPKGSGQVYSQPANVFCPTDFGDDQLMYRCIDENGCFDLFNTPFPVVIQAIALEGEEPRQSHSLIALVERNYTSGSYTLKPFLQKTFIDGLCYLIQEIYGIENKTSSTLQPMTVTENNLPDSDLKDVIPLDSVQRYISPEEELEDSSASECVVCLSDSRDTLILPCRHLCLCFACADSLRYQANNCPICRAPFRALLQIQAVRRAMNMNGSSITVPTLMTPASLPSSSSGNLCNVGLMDGGNIPVGYESLPLVEALNGPLMSCSASSWSNNRPSLPPDIERTPVSVRRSHRSHRSHHYAHHGSHAPSHLHQHLHHPQLPRRILSAGHGDSVVVSEEIPLPSRRLTSSQSVRSASPSSATIVMTPASCHPMTPHFPISSSSMTSNRTSPLPSGVTHGLSSSIGLQHESPKTDEPPEPAPLDWKVQSSRIHRKTSDPDDLEESSSSTSSSVVPQETTRLLPGSSDQQDNSVSMEMMLLRSQLRSPTSIGRKSPNRIKSSFSTSTSSPKNRHRDLSSSTTEPMLSHSMSSPLSPDHVSPSRNIRVNPCSDDELASSSSASVIMMKSVSDDDSDDGRITTLFQRRESPTDSTPRHKRGNDEFDDLTKDLNNLGSLVKLAEGESVDDLDDVNTIH